jgi:hypothetical protein
MAKESFLLDEKFSPKITKSSSREEKKKEKKSFKSLRRIHEYFLEH